MSTERNKRNVIVGLFVTIGLLILVAAVFTLGGQQKAFVPSLTVKAIFPDVNGLQKGDNVWFSGVKVGTVKRVDFVGTSQVLVTMHIEKKAQEFVRKDAKAKIGAEGLIGNKIVVIYGGTPQGGQIEGNEQLMVEKTQSTEDMLATLQKNNENLVSITTDFKSVSHKLASGEGTIGALLNDMALYKSLQNTAANLQKAARNSEQLSSSIADFTAQLKTPGSLANGLVSDTTIMTNLKVAMAQINDAANEASSFTTNLKTASNQLNSNDNALGLLLNDEQAAGQMRGILQNLNAGSRKLDENLEALQHNFLFRGYFRKKAKREAEEAKTKVTLNTVVPQ